MTPLEIFYVIYSIPLIIFFTLIVLSLIVWFITAPFGVIASLYFLCKLSREAEDENITEERKQEIGEKTRVYTAYAGLSTGLFLLLIFSSIIDNRESQTPQIQEISHDHMFTFNNLETYSYNNTIFTNNEWIDVPQYSVASLWNTTENLETFQCWRNEGSVDLYNKDSYDQLEKHYQNETRLGSLTEYCDFISKSSVNDDKYGEIFLIVMTLLADTCLWGLIISLIHEVYCPKIDSNSSGNYEQLDVTDHNNDIDHQDDIEMSSIQNPIHKD